MRGNGHPYLSRIYSYFFVCFITKLFLTYSFFSPAPALSTISRPLSSSMCSITLIAVIRYVSGWAMWFIRHKSHSRVSIWLLMLWCLLGTRASAIIMMSSPFTFIRGCSKVTRLSIHVLSDLYTSGLPGGWYSASLGYTTWPWQLARQHAPEDGSMAQTVPEVTAQKWIIVGGDFLYLYTLAGQSKSYFSQKDKENKYFIFI